MSEDNNDPKFIEEKGEKKQKRAKPRIYNGFIVRFDDGTIATCVNGEIKVYLSNRGLNWDNSYNLNDWQNRITGFDDFYKKRKHAKKYSKTQKKEKENE